MQIITAFLFISLLSLPEKESNVLPEIMGTGVLQVPCDHQPWKPAQLAPGQQPSAGRR